MRVKQINESIHFIIESFFRLLSTQNYHEITMSDIAHEAQVSRMTLYRYFKNKEAITKHFISKIIEDFKTEIQQHPSPNFLSILYTRNKLIYENPKLRTAFNHEIIEQFFKEVIHQSQTLINQYMPNANTVSKYKRLFVIGGITHITREWVESGLQETPEEITHECIKVLRQLKD